MNYEDLLSQLDVLAVDSLALDDFGANGASILTDKRRLAVEWLQRGLERDGLSPSKHMTRHVPKAAFQHTGGSYTDRTAVLSDTSQTLDLSAVFATPGNDSLFIAHEQPFNGLYAGMLDAVNALNTTAINSVTYWNGGQWAGVNSLSDGTSVSAVSGAWSGGGRISWQLPTDMQKRPLSTQTQYLYWVRLRVSRAPTAGTNLIQLLPIRRSRLTLPAAYHALALLYDDGDPRHRGEWQEKVDRYHRKAGEMLMDALRYVRDEFDIDEGQAVSDDEINSVSLQQSWTVERG